MTHIIPGRDFPDDLYEYFSSLGEGVLVDRDVVSDGALSGPGHNEHTIFCFDARSPMSYESCRKMRADTIEKSAQFVIRDSEGNFHADIDAKKPMVFVLSPRPEQRTLPKEEVRRNLAAFVSLVEEDAAPSKELLDYVAWGVRRYLEGHKKAAWPGTGGRSRINRIHVINSYNAERIKGQRKDQAKENVMTAYEISEDSVDNILNSVIP